MTGTTIETTSAQEQRAGHGLLKRSVGRLAPTRTEKPRIRRLMTGGWLCEGGNLGGTGWNPAGAYRAWLWNMVHNGSEDKLREFGLLPP